MPNLKKGFIIHIKKINKRRIMDDSKLIVT